jgi:FHA domain
MAKDGKAAKTLGRKQAAPVKGAAEAKSAGKEKRASAPADEEPTKSAGTGRAGKSAGRSAAAAASEPKEELLAAVERALLEQLVTRMQLTPREILARALHSYAAAVAPGMKLPAINENPVKGKGKPEQRLFLSVDGKPEIEIEQGDYLIGAAEGCDLRLQLPLIAPQHARLLWREGRHLFEDLRSPRGSYLHGQPLDVRFIESGDEIDLGGFLPLRFRLA